MQTLSSHVDIDRHDQGVDEEGTAPDELIDEVVGNDSKWGGVEELMVGLVLVPQGGVGMSEVVVEKLEKVAGDPAAEKRGDKVGPRVLIGDATVGLRKTMVGEVY